MKGGGEGGRGVVKVGVGGGVVNFCYGLLEWPLYYGFLLYPSGVAFCCALLLWPSGDAFYALLDWPSTMPFCCGLLLWPSG